MTIMMFVTHFFKKEKTYSGLFSSALSEGIKDMFEEMGYRIPTADKKDTNC
jgi:hypothetical protein